MRSSVSCAEFAPAAENNAPIASVPAVVNFVKTAFSSWIVSAARRVCLNRLSLVISAEFPLSTAARAHLNDRYLYNDRLSPRTSRNIAHAQAGDPRPPGPRSGAGGPFVFLGLGLFCRPYCPEK